MSEKITLCQETSDHLRKIAASMDVDPEDLVKAWCMCADDWTELEATCKT